MLASRPFANGTVAARDLSDLGMDMLVAERAAGDQRIKRAALAALRPVVHDPLLGPLVMVAAWSCPMRCWYALTAASVFGPK